MLDTKLLLVNRFHFFFLCCLYVLFHWHFPWKNVIMNQFLSHTKWSDVTSINRFKVILTRWRRCNQLALQSTSFALHTSSSNKTHSFFAIEPLHHHPSIAHTAQKSQKHIEYFIRFDLFFIANNFLKWIIGRSGNRKTSRICKHVPKNSRLKAIILRQNIEIVV